MLPVKIDFEESINRKCEAREWQQDSKIPIIKAMWEQQINKIQGYVIDEESLLFPGGEDNVKKLLS